MQDVHEDLTRQLGVDLVVKAGVALQSKRRRQRGDRLRVLRRPAQDLGRLAFLLDRLERVHFFSALLYIPERPPTPQKPRRLSEILPHALTSAPATAS